MSDLEQELVNLRSSGTDFAEAVRELETKCAAQGGNE